MRCGEERTLTVAFDHLRRIDAGGIVDYVWGSNQRSLKLRAGCRRTPWPDETALACDGRDDEGRDDGQGLDERERHFGDCDEISWSKRAARVQSEEQRTDCYLYDRTSERRNEHHGTSRASNNDERSPDLRAAESGASAGTVLGRAPAMRGRHGVTMRWARGESLLGARRRRIVGGPSRTCRRRVEQARRTSPQDIGFDRIGSSQLRCASRHVHHGELAVDCSMLWSADGVTLLIR